MNITLLNLGYETFCYLFVFIVATEATTELISKSDIFLPFRRWFFNRRINKLFNFIHSMLECPYCASVWVGCFYATMFYVFLVTNHYILLLLPTILFFHRLANVFHFLIDRLRGGV
jgi:hypothetical protein